MAGGRAARAEDTIANVAVRWGPVVAWLAVISYLSRQPTVPIPGGTPDWLLHAAEFGILAALLMRATAGAGRGGFRRAALVTIVCGAAGALDEYHQSFVPGRTASVSDAAADLAGAALVAGAALARGLAPRRGAGEGPEVTLLGRRECHLCDDAERTLADVLSEYGLTYHKTDVDEDPALTDRYGAEVPVVLVDGRKAFKHRVDPLRLRRMLEARLRRSTG